VNFCNDMEQATKGGSKNVYDSVYQALLVKPDQQGQSGLPLTRADWYGEA